MTQTSRQHEAEDQAMLAAVRDGDELAFEQITERYRRQLHVHCYRMVGSFADAEDLVQETLLRAWRARTGFEGRSLVRTWLYRIATNVCLTALERQPRRVLPSDIVPATDPDALAVHEPPRWNMDVPWLTPFPDSLLEPRAPIHDEPDAVAVSRETIELAYLAALQHLPPRQRAVLILRDAMGWSEKETANLLETSVASIKSAHQRAKSTMRTQLPPGRLEWAAAPSTDEEVSILKRFMDAYDRADAAALTAILRDDARQTMPPLELWFDGRAAIVAHHAQILAALGAFRMLATMANRQRAAAAYLRRHGETEYRLSGLNVLRIEGGRIAEITSFSPDLCPAFDLPATL